MKSPSEIAALNDKFLSADYLKFAALVMTSKNAHEALGRAEMLGASERIIRVLKAAQAAGTTGTTGLSGLGVLAGAFTDTLKNYGALDRIAQFAMRVPDFVGRVSIASSVAVSSVAEGVAKPIRRVQLSSTDFTPVKVAAQIVMTKELIDGLTDAGLQALGRELRTSVAVGSDTEFLAALSGNTAEAEGADTFAGFMNDFEELMRLVQLGIGSRPFLILTPQLCKELALQATTAGIDTLDWNGGTLAGVEILCSDAQTLDRATLVDATSLAIALGEIELRSSQNATVEMDTAPTQSSATPTATAVVSMFQTNSRCLLAERAFAVKAIRPNAYAHLTNIALGETGGSPAGIL